MDPVTLALQSAIEGWATALATEALNPQPSYNIDGEQIDYDGWRDSLMKKISDGQSLIAKRNPWMVATRGVVGCP